MKLFQAFQAASHLRYCSVAAAMESPPDMARLPESFLCKPVGGKKKKKQEGKRKREMGPVVHGL